MTRPDWQRRGLQTDLAMDGQFASLVPPDTLGHVADMDALHELFHEQSKYHRQTAQGLTRQIRAYIEQPGLVAQSVSGRHERAGAQAVRLPDPEPMQGTLADALADRKSARRGDIDRPLCGQKLSALLHHGLRSKRSGRPAAAPHLYQRYRPYPSGGALYPCEIYLAINAVDGLSAGIYRYDVVEHVLVGVVAGAEGDFASVETGLPPADPPPCALIVTGVFGRSVCKYGLRGYRFALMEAGHILQNCSLITAALGLAGHVSASFHEAELEALLGVDGVSEAVLAAFLIGAGETC